MRTFGQNASLNHAWSGAITPTPSHPSKLGGSQILSHAYFDTLQCDNVTNIKARSFMITSLESVFGLKKKVSSV
jgi:hypothetical protein